MGIVVKTLYLIRHAVIQSNVEDRYSGRSSERLTDVGMEGADQLGREMRDWGITVIYTSPLARTIQTAEALNRHIAARLVLEPALLEMDLGPWTGLSKDEVAETYPSEYRSWVENPATFRFDKLETLPEILERTMKFITAFFADDSEEVAAMVTHAVVIKTAFLYMNHMSLNSYHKILVPNLSVHKVVCEKDLSGCIMVRTR